MVPDVHLGGTWLAADSTTLTGSVVWIDNDNGAGRRPQSVLVHLLADGQDTGINVTVDEAMGWKGPALKTCPSLQGWKRNRL